MPGLRDTERAVAAKGAASASFSFRMSSNSPSTNRGGRHVFARASARFRRIRTTNATTLRPAVAQPAAIQIADADGGLRRVGRASRRSAGRLGARARRRPRASKMKRFSGTSWTAQGSSRSGRSSPKAPAGSRVRCQLVGQRELAKLAGSRQRRPVVPERRIPAVLVAVGARGIKIGPGVGQPEIARMPGGFGTLAPWAGSARRPTALPAPARNRRISWKSSSSAILTSSSEYRPVTLGILPWANSLVARSRAFWAKLRQETEGSIVAPLASRRWRSTKITFSLADFSNASMRSSRASAGSSRRKGSRAGSSSALSESSSTFPPPNGSPAPCAGGRARGRASPGFRVRPDRYRKERPLRERLRWSSRPGWALSHRQPGRRRGAMQRCCLAGCQGDDRTVGRHDPLHLRQGFAQVSQKAALHGGMEMLLDFVYQDDAPRYSHSSTAPALHAHPKRSMSQRNVT